MDLDETFLSQMEVMAKSMQSTRDQQASLDMRLLQIESKLRLLETTPSPVSPLPKVSGIKGNDSPVSSERTTLSGYFKENGFKVIDYRTSGGALWVIGSEEKLMPYVSYAEKYYGVTGRFGSGRATNGKPAWWTKAAK